MARGDVDDDRVEGPGRGQSQHAGLPVAAPGGDHLRCALAGGPGPPAGQEASVGKVRRDRRDPALSRPGLSARKRPGGPGVRAGDPPDPGRPAARPANRAGGVRGDRPPGPSRVRRLRRGGPGVPLAIGPREPDHDPAQPGLGLGRDPRRSGTARTGLGVSRWGRRPARRAHRPARRPAPCEGRQGDRLGRGDLRRGLGAVQARTSGRRELRHPSLRRHDQGRIPRWPAQGLEARPGRAGGRDPGRVEERRDPARDPDRANPLGSILEAVRGPLRNRRWAWSSSSVGRAWPIAWDSGSWR